MKYFKIILFSAFLQLVAIKSFAEPSVLFSDTTSLINICKGAYVLEDKTNKLSIREIIISKKFEPIKQDVLNLKTSASSFWIKFQIKNLTNRKDLLLELGYPTLDEVEFYTLVYNDNFKIVKTGDLQIFSNRKYAHQYFLFDINIPKDSTITYFLKIKSTDQILVPLKVGTNQIIFESLLPMDLIFGIYFGVIFVMFCYNLFIYFIIKDISYLYYVIYIILIGFTQASIYHYPFKYLWPNNPAFANHNTVIFAALSGIFAVEFFKMFVQTHKYTPRLNKLFYIFNGIYIIAIILNLTGFSSISYRIIDLNGAPLSLLILYLAFIISKKGSRPAKFFLLAWTIFLIGVLFFALRNFGIFSYNIYTNYTLVAGSAIEVIVLSFALADRINILKREKEDSQAKTLIALQENEKIVINQNILLELKVKERTHALEASNKELKETQTQLVNIEKMASLGQLTAGIAHEINNPINFVISNIKPLRRDVEEILQLLAKYGEITNDIDLKEKFKEIDTLKQSLDTDYVIQEINLLLKGIDEGAYRTSEIVKGLQSFSRLDESDLKRVNIHEGIDATLVLLNNNSVREKIQIIKDYDKALPPVECYPGKLNQVFMNIINNAIQSLAAQRNRQTAEEGKIIIKTKAEGHNVIICIKDNGMGIPENIKSKIFEPFFTTKDVGSGTGLGLSIVYGIIQSHNGNIKVESEESKGAEFIITLPIVYGK